MLEQHQGRQTATYEQRLQLLQHLHDYGWVISLRMWSREEIVIICIILLDSVLQFNPILQKYLGKNGERDQIRGMATLDDRVQAVLYE